MEDKNISQTNQTKLSDIFQMDSQHLLGKTINNTIMLDQLNMQNIENSDKNKNTIKLLGNQISPRTELNIIQNPNNFNIIILIKVC